MRRFGLGLGGEDNGIRKDLPWYRIGSLSSFMRRGNNPVDQHRQQKSSVYIYLFN